MKETCNMTGLYVSGFIQEGYLPPQERRSTIPSTFYRGHVVKLARAPNSNPHRNSVERYRMHSLNSGFNGLVVPLKDKKCFKKNSCLTEFPLNQYWTKNQKVHGRWTNFPMLVGIRKIAGISSHFPSNSIDQQTLRTDTDNSRNANFYQEGVYHHDDDEEGFYQHMFNEINQVVSVQEDDGKLSRARLKRILLNTPGASSASYVEAKSASKSRRAMTSYGYVSDHSITKHSTRPLTSEIPSKEPFCSSLLLPLPYVPKSNFANPELRSKSELTSAKFFKTDVARRNASAGRNQFLQLSPKLDAFNPLLTQGRDVR